MKVLRWIRLGLALVLLGSSIVYFTRSNPIGPLAGRGLSGDEVAAPVEDWSFSDAYQTVAIETRPAKPHSVTTVAFTHEGALYVPARNGSSKGWPHYAVSDPRVRVKIGDEVYPGRATRVTDPDTLATLREAARAKYDVEIDAAEAEAQDVWVFRIDPPQVAAAPPSAASATAPDAAQLRAEYEALVAAPDRTEADRERDARRHPVELLAFAGVRPGMRVADLGASSGYTTELLSRAVGAEGRVYGQNTPYVLEKYVSESWPARLARPVNTGVVRIDSGFEDPLPEVRGLDLVTMIYVYHDALGRVDRTAMNAAIHASLAPGGSLVVVDHRAKPGSGEEAGQSVHRIDEALLRRELLAAGFQLAAEADFLANPDDPREEAFFRMDGPTDAFVHRYVKP